MALLLNQEMRQSVLRAIMVLPLFATPVGMGFLGITLFYEINRSYQRLFLRTLGIEGIPWLSTPQWAPVAVMLIDIWQWTPFVFLVSLAACRLLVDLYEAAEVDGASGWDSFRNITLPLMTPTLWLILLLRLVEAFKVFDIPASMTLGGPAAPQKSTACSPIARRCASSTTAMRRRRVFCCCSSSC